MCPLISNTIASPRLTWSFTRRNLPFLIEEIVRDVLTQ